MSVTAGAVRCPTGFACSGCRYCEAAREAVEAAAVVFGGEHGLNYAASIVRTDIADRDAWAGHLWRACCECGFEGPLYRHPLDASMGLRHDHVPAILPVDR